MALDAAGARLPLPRSKHVGDAELSRLRQRGVVAIAPLPPPSGGQTACAAMLLRALDAAEVPAWTVDLSRPFRPGRTRLRRTGDAVARVLAAAAIEQAIRRSGTRPLVYLHLGWGAASMLRDQLLLASPLARRLPIVGHVHGGGFREGFEALPKPARAVHASLLRRLDRIIVLSGGLRAMFEGVVAPERVRVVENGVDREFAEFARRLPTRQSPNGTLRVLFLSHLIDEKGYEDLLLTAAEAHRRDLPFHFTLAGERTERGHLDPEAFIAAHCSGSASWLGGVNGAARHELFRSHDVLVLPSRREGVPLVLLEAMHAGLPVVTTRVGGIPETIEDGENGLFVAAGRPRQIADRLEWLLEHPDDYLAISERNRERARRRYSPERHERELVRVLSEAATAPRG